MRYIAAELGPKGIRVHAISPGPLATRAASGIPEFDELLEKAKVKAPARELVDIDDVGAACAFLAHDAARLITGAGALCRRRLPHHRLRVAFCVGLVGTAFSEIGEAGAASAPLT